MEIVRPGLVSNAANRIVKRETASAPSPYGANALFHITQTRNGAVAGDAMLAIFNPALAAQQTLQFYIEDRGALYSGAELVLSQRHNVSNGAIVDLAAGESGCLTASPDGNFCAIKVDCGLVQYGANSYALAVFDADNIDPAYPSASGNFGSGYKRFVIGQTGNMLWGTALSTTPAANADLGMSRLAAGSLKVESYSGDAFLNINAASGQTPYLRWLRNGTTTLELAGTSTTTAQAKIGTTQVWNVYSSGSLGRMAVGGDRSTSSLSVLTQNGLAGLTVLQTSGGSPQNLLEITTSAGAIYSRFDKAGYFMTQKVAAPADADLGASEMALWLDATNGAAKLMIKAKSANGTVVTGQVALT